MMTRTYKENRAEQENYIYKPTKNCAQACFSFFPPRNGETEKKLWSIKDPNSIMDAQYK